MGVGGKRTPPIRRSYWEVNHERGIRTWAVWREDCRQQGAREGGRWRGCVPWLPRLVRSGRTRREILQMECGRGLRRAGGHRVREQQWHRATLGTTRLSWCRWTAKTFPLVLFYATRSVGACAQPPLRPRHNSQLQLARAGVLVCLLVMVKAICHSIREEQEGSRKRNKRNKIYRQSKSWNHWNPECSNLYCTTGGI
jgi:hypothetical protein